MTPLLRGEVVELPPQRSDPFSVLFSLIFWLLWGGFFLGSVFFEPSRAWWPGILLGVILGGVVMWLAVGTILSTIVGIIFS